MGDLSPLPAEPLLLVGEREKDRGAAAHPLLAGGRAGAPNGVHTTREWFQAAQEAARGADQQLVVPLLGAGARGAPDERAAAAAAKAASSWLLATGSTGEGQAEVMFCVVSVAAHAALESALREATKDML